MPYCLTSKIQDNCEYISGRSTVLLQVSATQAPKVEALPIQAAQRQVPRIQAPPIPAPSVPAASVQAPLVQGPPISALLAPLAPVERDRGQLGKHQKQVKIVLDKLDTFTNKHADAQLSTSEQKQELLEKDVFKVVIPDKVVTPEKVLNSTQVFNFRFVDEIKDPCTNKVYKKTRLVLQVDNDKDKNLELTKLPIIQQVCNLN